MFVSHELFAPLDVFSFSFSMYWVIYIHFQEIMEERKVLEMAMYKKR